MRQTVLAGLAALMLVAACGGSGDQPATGSQEPATAFMSGNPEPVAGPDPDTGLARDEYGRPRGYALLGEPLPEFSATLVGGGQFDSASISTWTLIDVWGIWCSDCMADAPYVAALNRAIAQDPNLDFISIHTPPSAARADEAYGRYGSVQAYFAEKGYSYPTVLDTDARLRETLQIAWTPSYILVSPEGTIEGFRTDLSAAGDSPVKQLLIDIAAVRAGWTPSALDVSELSIGPEGAGPLKGTTAFTLDAAQAAFPGLDIIAGQEMTEGETYPVFYIRSEAGETLFTLEPDWSRGEVSAVVTRSPDISGPDGAQIGMTRLPDVSGLDLKTCQPGLEEYADRLVCAPGGFAWIFALPEDYTGPTDAAPATILDRARLVEMRYLPPNRKD